MFMYAFVNPLLQPHRFPWISISGPLEFSSALRGIPRTIKAWWNDVDIFYHPFSPDVTGSESVVEDFYFLGEKCDKLGEHWIKGRRWPMGTNSTLLPMVFEDAKVIAAGSNIDLCKIRSGFTRKSKWRTSYRKYLYQKLQMEKLWNFSGIGIFVWVEQHGGTNNSTVRRQAEWEIKDGGLKPDEDMK